MSETLVNLTKAFIGESMARNRYTIYAKIAQKEGYEQISALFLETAEQEREHAKWLFKLINQIKKSDSPVLAEVDAPNVYGDTATNLRAAIAGESHEHTVMYPGFAEKADEEGYPDVAARLRSISKAEEHHEQRYNKLLKEVEGKTVFKKPEKVYWVCRKCGYFHEGEEPAKECPSCSHPSSYFQRQCETY